MLNTSQPISPSPACSVLPLAPHWILLLSFGVSLTAAVLHFQFVLTFFRFCCSTTREFTPHVVRPGRYLLYELSDLMIDACSFLMTFFEGEFSFCNDPYLSVMQAMLFVNAFSVGLFLLELLIYTCSKCSRDEPLIQQSHYPISKWFVVLHMVLEDVFQFVVYSFIAVALVMSAEGQASHWSGPLIGTVGSLAFMIQRLAELCAHKKRARIDPNPGSTSVGLVDVASSSST